MTDHRIRNALIRTVLGPCGPPRKNTLVGIAENLGAENAAGLVKAMIEAGKLGIVMGSRRGARYGVPKCG